MNAPEWYYEDCSGELFTDPDGRYLEQPYPCVMCGLPTHRLDIEYHVMLHEKTCRGGYEEGLEQSRQGLFNEWNF